jgi:DNA invertase Pin-like site-specific DNA recombinase
MLIGYARVFEDRRQPSPGSPARRAARCRRRPRTDYQDEASGKREDRPGLHACLKALRPGDILVVWKLDRLGRDLRHLVNTAQDLAEQGIGFKVLAGQGTEIDTTTASGKLVFGIFAALAEFERELIRERTKAGLASARTRGRKGGRRFDLSKAQVRLAQAAMQNRDTKVSELCDELGVTRSTLYRYVGPRGELREHGERVLGVSSKGTDRPSSRQNNPSTEAHPS